MTALSERIRERGTDKGVRDRKGQIDRQGQTESETHRQRETDADT